MDIYAKGSSISAISRVMGIKLVTVASWVKKGVQCTRILDMERTERSFADDLPAAVPPPATVISFNETRTYVNVRSGENRNSVFIWTSIV